MSSVSWFLLGSVVTFFVMSFVMSLYISRDLPAFSKWLDNL